MSGFDRTTSQETIKRASLGDREAMEAIYVEYIEACFRLSYRMLMDRQLAEDACQETFINIMKSIKNYKFEGSFAGWVRRILVNETLRKLNKQNRNETVEVLDLEDEQMSLFNSHWLSDVMDLEFFLKKLSPANRTVLVLHEIEGFRHAEIANILGKSESYSKMVLHRAYKFLRSEVQRQEVNYAPE